YLDPADPSTELESGWEAIIADPNGADFREFNILFHEIGNEDFVILRADDTPVPLIDDLTGVYRPVSRALNFRSEPFMDRLELVDDKSLGYSSYAFGDPATPIPYSYLGEATKTRISHPGSEMFHVYHLHGGATRWQRNPKVDPDTFTGGLQKVPTQDTESTRMDSQAIGPGEAFTLEHECGAGGCQQAAGDFLFHCHIGDHYISGMWAFWRVFDTVQDDFPEMPPDLNGNYTPPPVAEHGTSLDLLGTQVDGQTIVAEVDLVDDATELALEDYVAGILPPQGVRLDTDDATVWDWQIDYVDGDLTQPLVLGEPDDTAVWANYASETPGVRPAVDFNLDNARLAWPMFRPHLGTRPPFSPNGHGGAPWLGEDGDASRPDAVCPSTDVVPGRRVLNYPVTALDIPIEIADGIENPNGKIYALSENVDDIRDGTMPVEPLVLRSNVGDCSRIMLTSEQLDANHNGNAKVNMHTHMVQFDPQASDGVVTGYSYEQGVRPYANENRTLTAAAGPGANAITVTNVDRLRVGIDIGIGLGEGMCDLTGEPVDEPDDEDRPCAEVRRIVSIDGNVITLDEPLQNEHVSGEAAGVEFAQHLWYSDVDAGTVFWHDHVSFANWRDGLFGAHVIEPAGSTWHDPTTGDELRSGPIADIHAPPGSSQGIGQEGSFREVLAMMSDRTTITGPGVPAGTLASSINMRAAPLVLRDPAFPFSSVTNGDPDTAILRAYVGDPVVIRGLGVMDREGSLRVAGHRLRQERYLEGSALVDTVNIGISEREDLVLEGGAGGTAGLPGDFLFYNAVARDLTGGAWGVLRVHDTEQDDLEPLPDRGAPAPGAGFPTLTETGGAPPAATNPSGVCPAGAPERSYDVTALQNPDSLVDFGDFMYARTDQEALLLAGTLQPEPLVMRVNEGDCLRISLTNHFTTDRASIDLAKLNAAGPSAAVGWNADGSAAPGETVQYEFYADEELGTSLFFNLAAPHTIALGAFGAVVVEPAGSTWRSPFGPSAAPTGVRADILHPDGNFREHVLLMQESDERIGQN
ncbi:multicopper oxidase domain-containing protein, partial [Ilumatobacter sp.]|uniref:multicopper oxidase domain-containing protein n=1 Tax=Ilumatobacter sp. TaxID=1967498 RepID=UPI003C3C570E